MTMFNWEDKRMAGRHNSKRNQRSSKAKTRRRRNVVGVTGTAGAFLAFGMSPLANAPEAKADVLDVILDPLINSLGSFDPTLAVDLGSLPSSFDPTFADPALAALPTAGADLGGLALPGTDAAASADA